VVGGGYERDCEMRKRGFVGVTVMECEWWGGVCGRRGEGAGYGSGEKQGEKWEWTLVRRSEKMERVMKGGVGNEEERLL
jgi:hypothetical protein